MYISKLNEILNNISKTYKIDIDNFTIEECKLVLNSSEELKEYLKKTLDSSDDKKEYVLDKCKDLFSSTIIQLYLDEQDKNVIFEDETIYRTTSTNYIEKLYFDDALKYDVLNQNDEKKLFRTYRNGDINVRNKIINHNQRLVIKFAKKFAFNDELLLPLIQEGNIGLIKAIENFDIEKGFKFSTYASYYIKREMFNYLNSFSNSHNIPQRLYSINQKMNKIINEYYCNNIPIPSEEEFSAILKIPVSSVKELLFLRKMQFFSINDLISSENDSEMESLLQDNATLSPEEETIKKIERSDILNFLSSILTQEELKIIKMLYGFNEDNKCESLKTIAQKLKTNERQISFKQQKILKKIRCIGYDVLKDFK